MDAFGDSRPLPPGPSPRKPPSRAGVTARRSTASLRSSSNHAHPIDEDSANGRHSLAHELAVALMPEPSAGSALLAEEFGIEYDEGAEGIDEEQGHQEEMMNGTLSFAEEMGDQSMDMSIHENGIVDELPPDDTPTFDSSVAYSPPFSKRLETDPMELLATEVAFTDKFLSHLRRLDTDPSASSSQPTLEKIASDVIRRLDDTIRSREGQVRELLEYEREFRKIAGEIGGDDVLGQLDELEDMEDVSQAAVASVLPRSTNRTLAAVVEEPSSNDWEVDPEQNTLGDERDEYLAEAASPVKDAFSFPPLGSGPVTPQQAILQLGHLRTFTDSLVASLRTISDHAQVTGHATTDAGRKIRALKNKLGGWRTDWDSAERSRLKIEQWEAGIDEFDSYGTVLSPSLGSSGSRRIDGRKIVEEHMKAFERVLADANMKTEAIMAAS